MFTLNYKIQYFYSEQRLCSNCHELRVLLKLACDLPICITRIMPWQFAMLTVYIVLMVLWENDLQLNLI